jgi:hypothetical protein
LRGHQDTTPPRGSRQPGCKLTPRPPALPQIGGRLANVTNVDNTPVQWLQNFWNGGIVGDSSLSCIVALYNGKEYLYMNSDCSTPYPSVCKRSRGFRSRGCRAGAARSQGPASGPGHLLATEAPRQPGQQLQR